jgi:putative hydrolase of the HAD superfamily
MIKNLLFDLGGVVMNIRRENCVRAFEALGMTDANNLLGEYEQAGVFAGVENGSLSAAEFRDEIRRIIGRDIADDEIDAAFCKFLTGIPEERLKALEDLHGRFGMYVVSNTNPIMWNSEIARQFSKLGHDINYYFDGTVTSFEARAMKPDARIFEKVVADFGIRPDETLFFDDSKANCEAAEKLGFRTVHVAPGTEFMDFIKDYDFSK